MKIAVLILGFLMSINALAFSAKVKTSPAKVKASVFKIVVANDQRTRLDTAQTNRAAKLIVIGEKKKWHNQIKMKRYSEMFSRIDGA